MGAPASVGLLKDDWIEIYVKERKVGEIKSDQWRELKKLGGRG
jgi:hypothetical protein